MSDIEDYRALFMRTKVSFSEPPREEFGRQFEPGHQTLTVDADGPSFRHGFVNAGYTGYTVELEFDAEGKLLRFGVWG
jgi:hypothetical protein